MAQKPTKAKKRIIWLVCILLALFVVLPSIGTVIAYECIFGMRYETESWRKFTEADYEGLMMQRSDFDSEGVNIAGYKYYRDGIQPKGVVVIAHGLGCGGHNVFMPFIDTFVSNDYYVFSYDVHGNGESGGKSVEGLPRGLIDLDHAISHAETVEEYAGLPMMLFGHSWGAYSGANVLSLHPEIDGAVIIAGMNESEDMLLHYGKQYTGPMAPLMLPYLELYETIKFGRKYTETSGIEGMAQTDARIMIVHSADDDTVPIEYGYDTYFEAYGDDERFEFVRYENRGHADLFYSRDAMAYRAEFMEGYNEYFASSGIEETEESREAYLLENLDKTRAYEPDGELMEKILAMFEEC